MVGESGSGKSVMATTVMGLLPKEVQVAGGEVLLKGENLLQASTQRLRALRQRQVRLGAAEMPPCLLIVDGDPARPPALEPGRLFRHDVHGPDGQVRRADISHLPPAPRTCSGVHRAAKGKDSASIAALADGWTPEHVRGGGGYGTRGSPTATGRPAPVEGRVATSDTCGW